MRFLVDTHALIWFADADARLPNAARALIEDMNNIAYVSLASVWELAIKESIGKLNLASPIEQYLDLALAAFQVLPISYSHAIDTAKLPLCHRDPFDRMIVAQSLADQLPLISHDKQLDAYGIERWWQKAPKARAPDET
jgi:PIN domain nuclease of toxin-antitoxin system